MRTKLLGMVVVIVSAALFTSANAAALTFNWSYVGGGGGYGEFLGQGTLTADTTIYPNIDVITSISGTVTDPY